MTRMCLLRAILAPSIFLAGCGDSDKHPGSPAGKPGVANEISGICRTITATGLVKQCTINGHDNAVEVIIDSFDDEVARNVCAEIADKTTRLNVRLSGEWKLQVFSPYRSDKPMAACYLD